MQKIDAGCGRGYLTCARTESGSVGGGSSGIHEICPGKKVCPISPYPDSNWHVNCILYYLYKQKKKIAVAGTIPAAFTYLISMKKAAKKNLKKVKIVIDMYSGISYSVDVS